MQQADPVDSILGLTHPKRVFISSLNLWKRRGSAMSQAMKSTWVERLVLLTKDAFFWFERGFEGMDGLGPQHGRVELRHIRSMQLREMPGAPSSSVEELSSNGPKYQLEITHILSEQVVLLGATDAGVKGSFGNAPQ